MLQGPVRLAALSAVLAFGATGVALALVGLGLPFLLAAVLPAASAGLVVYAALRAQVPDPAPGRLPDQSAVQALRQEIEAHRAATAAMRHDLRGTLSPALMISDRLLNHADPAVQRAGQTVVRSIERATAALAVNKDALAGGATPPAP